MPSSLGRTDTFSLRSSEGVGDEIRPVISLQVVVSGEVAGAASEQYKYCPGSA